MHYLDSEVVFLNFCPIHNVCVCVVYVYIEKYIFLKNVHYSVDIEENIKTI